MMPERDPHPSQPPTGDATAAGPGQRLDGWKAIAGYLGRDVRTVQRWELSEGLPIHRLEHRQRASAYAFTGELDAWVASRAPADLSAEPDRDAGDGQDPAPGIRTEAAPPRQRPVRRLAWGLAGILALTVVSFGAWRVMAPGASNGDTTLPEAYSALAEGRALYLSRQYRDAAIALERAVTLDPEYGLAWAWLGKAYGRLAQPVWGGGRAAADRASDASDRAVRLAPRSADAHIAHALAARGRGDVQGWRARAQKAVDLDPRAAEAIALLGDSYSAVVYSCAVDQDAELAETYYRKAMDLMPGLTTTASNRAGNLRRLGRYGECVDLMNRTMRDYPDETPLRAVRGACRLMLGDIEGAAQDIESLRNNPRIATAGSLVYLGWLELATGRTEEGVRDLEAFTQFDRGARAELIVAETYGFAGQVERAAQHVRRAVDMDAACAGFVERSLGFQSIRRHPAMAAALAARSPQPAPAR